MPQPTPAADLEFSLRAEREIVSAEVRFRDPASAADSTLAAQVPVRLDQQALAECDLDPQTYGRTLAEMLFADQRLRSAWQRAHSYVHGASTSLRLRLRLDPGADALHRLRWETLQDPDAGTPLCMSERVMFSRYLDSPDLARIIIPSPPDLKALVAIANPSNLNAYLMAPIDIPAEVERCATALGGIPTTIVAHGYTGGRATLDAIATALRDEPHILYLVCHGTMDYGQPYLWLEHTDGSIARVAGEDFAHCLANLAHRPLLVVLASCQSAGDGASEALTALGPQLARAGIAAVVAMQGNVSMATVATFMPVFFRELRRDGQIDRALAAARLSIRDRLDWWMPVLFLRVRDGRLWRPPDDEHDEAELLARYRQRVLDANELVNLAGIPLPLDRSGQVIAPQVPLERVYIRIQAMPRQQRRAEEEAERRQVEQRIAGADSAAPRSHDSLFAALRALSEYLYRQGQVYQAAERPQPIDPQAALQKHRRLVILGPPGAGKSTLLRFLARAAAADPDGPLPILVSLRDFAAYQGQGAPSLRTFALEQAAGGDAALRRALEQAPRHLWLVDALDEAHARRDTVIDQVQQLDGDLVLTSRPFNYYGGSLQALPHFEILPLATGDVDRFLGDWFAVLAEARGQGQAEVEERVAWLKGQLAQRPRIQALIRNPLLLTFLVILAGEDPLRELPAQRAELYRRYVEGLLDSWEARRREHSAAGVPGFTLGPLAGDHARQTALQGFYYLGWYLHLAYHGGPADYLPTEQAIVTGLARFLEVRLGEPPRQAPHIARAILIFWQEAGMLDHWRLQGRTYLAFRHLTFQEYAAAWGLGQAWRHDPKQSWAFLRPRLHHYAWREPILLLAALLEQKQRDDLVARLLRGASIYERSLHRDLRLAGAIMGEGVPLDKRCQRQLLRRLTWLCHSYDNLFLLTLVIIFIAGLQMLELVFGAGTWLFSGASAFWLLVCMSALTSQAPSIRAVMLLPPRLWHLLSDPEPVLRVLSQLGPAAVPSLLSLLRNGDWFLQQSAAEALGQLALSDLRQALQDWNSGVRLVAAQVLGQLGDTTALPHLRRALLDPEWYVRRKAAQVLGQLGDAAALPYLRQALQDRNSDVRYAVAVALGQLGDAAALPHLRQALLDPEWYVRRTAAQVLGQLGGSALPDLHQALQDRNSDVRQAAIYELGQLGGSALPDLRQVLQDRNSDMRQAAAVALGQIGDAALSDLRQALLDQDSDVRQAAAVALGQLGDAALPHLRQALLDPEWYVRRTAAQALGQLGNAAVLPVLRQALQDQYSNVRYAVVEALGQLGDTTALPNLRQALQDPYSDVRQAAAVALGRVALHLDDRQRLAQVAQALWWRLTDEEDVARAAFHALDQVVERLAVLDAQEHRAADPLLAPPRSGRARD